MANKRAFFLRRLTSRFLVFIQQICAAWRITVDYKSFTRLSVDLALYRMMRYIPMLGRNRPRTLNLPKKIQLCYRLNRGDIWTIYEVWMQRAYRLPFQVGPGALIDLGSNIGLTSLWYDKNIGFSQIIAIEPSAENAEIARRNFSNNRLAGEVVRAAIGPIDGEATLYEYNRSTNNELVFTARHEARIENGLRLVRRSSVPVLSLEKVLGLLPPSERVSLLKMDIEGSEQELLTGNTAWLDRVDAIVAEFHPPRAEVERLCQILEHRGLHYIPPNSSCPLHSFIRNCAQQNEPADYEAVTAARTTVSLLGSGVI